MANDIIDPKATRETLEGTAMRVRVDSILMVAIVVRKIVVGAEDRAGTCKTSVLKKKKKKLHDVEAVIEIIKAVERRVIILIMGGIVVTIGSRVVFEAGIE
jgi:hypothetical protein